MTLGTPHDARSPQDGAAPPTTLHWPLPHSGLVLPDGPHLAVVTLQEGQTPRGVAWSARVHRGETFVGIFENYGDGGMNRFTPDDPAAFGHVEFERYARQCTRAGQPIEPDALQDHLVNEYDFGRFVAAAAARCRWALRLLTPDDFPLGRATITCAPTDPPARRTLLEQVADGWEGTVQYWDDQAWIELTDEHELPAR